MAIESSPSGAFSASPQNVGDKLSAAAADAKSRAEGLGHKAADTVDRARDSAADGIKSAAAAVENGVAEGGTRVKRAAKATADALSSSADYLRDNSARDMMDDAMDVVKANPGMALLGAVALGFVVGRAFSSRT